ncbi:MAG: endonuclease domain-containing protein [Minisyncoccia bacterium]
MKTRRQELRRKSTPEEKFLWLSLRQNKLGYKFTRQYSFGPYIFDFYCAKAKLVIELDGERHDQNKEYDRERDFYSIGHGIRVLRFWNAEVNDNIDTVLEIIKKNLTDLTSPPLL